MGDMAGLGVVFRFDLICVAVRMEWPEGWIIQLSFHLGLHLSGWLDKDVSSLVTLPLPRSGMSSEPEYLIT